MQESWSLAYGWIINKNWDYTSFIELISGWWKNILYFAVLEQERPNKLYDKKFFISICFTQNFLLNTKIEMYKKIHVIKVKDNFYNCLFHCKYSIYFYKRIDKNYRILWKWPVSFCANIKIKSIVKTEEGTFLTKLNVDISLFTKEVKFILLKFN